MRSISLFVLAIAFAATLGTASAAPITIYGTGLNNSGSQLPNQTTDPHWTVSGPMGSGAPVASTLDAGFPIGPYLSNGASLSSSWIMPGDGTANTHLPGQYTYTTTFDLTGLNPATAVITGRWIADNDRLSITLNSSVFNVINDNGANGQSFGGAWLNFLLNSGFINGINTLSFTVNNRGGQSGNPTAVRIELSGSAQPVPEPATMTLFALLGAGTLVGVARRRLA